MINSGYTVRYGFDAKEGEFCRSTRQGNVETTYKPLLER